MHRDDENPHYAFPSTVGGIALDSKGTRLAVSHYGGAALLYPKSAESSRFALKWAGSHLACTLSPDCDYLVTQRSIAARCSSRLVSCSAWRFIDTRTT